jgi:hypothetical protein
MNDSNENLSNILFEMMLQEADLKNRNNRIYGKSLFESVVTSLQPKEEVYLYSTECNSEFKIALRGFTSVNQQSEKILM